VGWADLAKYEGGAVLGRKSTRAETNPCMYGVELAKLWLWRGINRGVNGHRYSEDWVA